MSVWFLLRCCRKHLALEFPNLWLNLMVLWCVCPPFPHRFLLLYTVLCCYVSPPLLSLSSHCHSVYAILRVDRTLSNLLVSQTFISLCLIHQSAPRFVPIRRDTKEAAPAKPYKNIYVHIYKYIYIFFFSVNLLSHARVSCQQRQCTKILFMLLYSVLSHLILNVSLCSLSKFWGKKTPLAYLPFLKICN